MSSRHGTFARMMRNTIELEFTVNDMNEIDEILSQYLDVSLCSKPNIRFISEDQIEIKRSCNNLQINYEVIKMGRALRVKAKFENLRNY